MRIYKSPTRDAIAALLVDGVPRSVPEISQELNLHIKAVEASIRDARLRNGIGLKGFVIAEWHHYRGKGGRASPMYLNGGCGRVDLRRPKADPKDNSRRYAAKMKAVIRAKNAAKHGRQINPWLQLLGDLSRR